MPPPTNRALLKSVLGSFSYFRRWVRDFSRIAQPLTDLLRNPDKPFKWGPEEQNAFETLKKTLTEAPVLAKFQPGLPIILQTDASKDFQPFPISTI